MVIITLPSVLHTVPQSRHPEQQLYESTVSGRSPSVVYQVLNPYSLQRHFSTLETSKQHRVPMIVIWKPPFHDIDTHINLQSQMIDWWDWSINRLIRNVNHTWNLYLKHEQIDSSSAWLLNWPAQQTGSSDFPSKLLYIQSTDLMWLLDSVTYTIKLLQMILVIKSSICKSVY